MAGELMFTQSEKILANRRKNLFVLAGMLPLFLAAVSLIWLGSVGRQVFGIRPEDVAFILPLVLAVQLILLATRMPSLFKKDLKLSYEAIEITSSGEKKQIPLRDLRKIRVRRDTEGVVTNLSLHFSGKNRRLTERFIRLSGYFEMNVLRDMLIRYAQAIGPAQLRVIDS